MRPNQIEISNNQVTILTRKTSVIIRLFLLMILSILVSIPLLGTLFVLSKGDGLHIGVGFSFIVCWGIGFYLLRILLWNTYGRELLTLSQESIQYIADYKLFKDGFKEISTTNLQTEIIYDNRSDNTLGRLKIKGKSTSIETVLETSITDLEKLKKEIKTRYNI